MRSPFIYTAILFAGFFAITSCKSTNLRVEKTYKLKEQSKEIKQIVCIDPDIKKYVLVGQSLMLIDTLSRDYHRYMGRKIEAKSKKYGFETKVAEAEDYKANEQLFFDELLDLKNEIIYAAITQGSFYTGQPDFDFEPNAIRGSKTSRHFYMPFNFQISPKYSHLKDVFGTPYFLVTGLYSRGKTKANDPKKRDHTFYYYFYLVNIETAEVIYSAKHFSSRPVTKKLVKEVVGQSFEYMN